MDPYEAKFLKSSRVVSLPPGDPARSPLSLFKALRSGPNHRFFPDGTLQQRVEEVCESTAFVHDLGHGNVEAVVIPKRRWVEIEPLSDTALADALQAHANPPALTLAEMEYRASANEDRSCRRSRTKVRRLAKFKRLDTMLTLTYQHNQVDRSLAQLHLAAFVRRVKKVVPGFEYIAVPELQVRGAFHWHLAVRQLSSGYWVKGVYVHSWKLFRAIWRSVIKGGGNIDVQARGKPGRGVHKLSAYLTKYITKGFSTGAKGENRYQASGHALPASVRLDLSCIGQSAVAALVLTIAPEWLAGHLHVSPPLASGGYFICITPGG